MPPLAAPPLSGGGGPVNRHPPPMSFAAVTAGKPAIKSPRLAPVPIANRPLSYIDNVPALIFTPIEVEQLNKQRENTLIMKFSLGRPQLPEVRAHIAAEWNLETPPAVGYMDGRHVTVHMGSLADTIKALVAKPKIKNSLYRIFRWTSEFRIGKESSMVSVSVRLHNLPLQFYNDTSLRRIESVLGNVLKICPDTVNLTQQMYARICVELDVSKPMLDTIFVGTSKEDWWFQEVEMRVTMHTAPTAGFSGM